MATTKTTPKRSNVSPEGTNWPSCKFKPGDLCLPLVGYLDIFERDGHTRVGTTRSVSLVLALTEQTIYIEGDKTFVFFLVMTADGVVGYANLDFMKAVKR